MATETGTVVWFNKPKGFGFIQRDNGGKDAYVHRMDLGGRGGSHGVFEPERDLEEGQRVAFEVEENPKGPRAKSVRLVPAERGSPIVETTFDFGLK